MGTPTIWALNSSDYFERVEQTLVTLLKIHDNKYTNSKNRVS
jgi:hypothetical protein